MAQQLMTDINNKKILRAGMKVSKKMINKQLRFRAKLLNWTTKNTTEASIHKGRGKPSLIQKFIASLMRLLAPLTTLDYHPPAPMQAVSNPSATKPLNTQKILKPPVSL